MLSLLGPPLPGLQRALPVLPAPLHALRCPLAAEEGQVVRRGVCFSFEVISPLCVVRYGLDLFWDCLQEQALPRELRELVPASILCSSQFG